MFCYLARIVLLFIVFVYTYLKQQQQKQKQIKHIIKSHYYLFSLEMQARMFL